MVPPLYRKAWCAVAWEIRPTHDLPGGVDAVGETVGAAQSAEVGYGATAIQEGMLSDIARELRTPTTCPTALMPATEL